jgi:hypothetical protein
MPPVGSSVLDQKAIALLQAWISEDLPKYELFNAWAARIFAGRSDLDASPAGDPDDDGHTNYEEYLAGTDPLSRTSKSLIQPEIINGQVKLSLTQQPNRALLIESTHSLTYPSWQFLNVLGNQVAFPAQSVDRSILDLFEGGENYYRIRIFEP